MGRTRPNKIKRTKPTTAESAAEREAPSIQALLQKAQTLVVQCDYELAEKFTRRILERDVANAEAREMLGVIQLETGELDSAKEVHATPFTFGASAEEGSPTCRPS